MFLEGQFKKGSSQKLIMGLCFGWRSGGNDFFCNPLLNSFLERSGEKGKTALRGFFHTKISELTQKGNVSKSQSLGKNKSYSEG